MRPSQRDRGREREGGRERGEQRDVGRKSLTERR